MITLFLYPATSRTLSVTALLEITPKDVDHCTYELTRLFNEAKASKRKVGCVVRQIGGDSYFTYDDANRVNLELMLIAALIVPKAEVYVTRD